MQNTLHLKAPGNWINDPNGFLYYKGKYHLFYQYFPYEPRWGTMHWGHAVSDDLVHWEHLGVALYPTKEYDSNGVFSGSSIEKDGRMQLYYTAVHYLEEDPECILVAKDGRNHQSQAMICSEDGYHFDNLNGKKQIIPSMIDTAIGDPQDCRDPKVWREGEGYYMCLASTHLSEEGVLLIYHSEDSEHWEYCSRVQDKRLGHTLECPDIFRLGDQYALICSPMGRWKGTEFPESQSTMQRVEFDPATGKVVLGDKEKYLDYGFDMYAPQSNLDVEGRRTVIAWVRMPSPQKAEDNEASGGRAWNGMMSLPRLVELRSGELVTPVHPNVRAYFDDAEHGCCAAVQDGTERLEAHWLKEGRERILVTMREGESRSVRGVEISMQGGCICLDRTGLLPEGVTWHTKSKTPHVGSQCLLEIFAETNLVEVFVNDGQYVISNVIYPKR